MIGQVEKDFFLDMKNAKAQLEYSYDPIESQHPTGKDMQWQALEVGVLENDFAVEMMAVNAIRLRVMNVGEEGVSLQVFEKKVDEYDAR